MDYLNIRVLKNWVVPVVTMILFFTFLMEWIPYATGYGWVKIPLGTIIWVQCITTPEYEYCLVVPFISLFLLYTKWDLIVRQPVHAFNGALGVAFVALLIYWLGLRAEMQYFGFFAIQILLAALVMWFWGTAVFRAAIFPWAFLAFAWPLPFLEPIISVPLRLTMSHLAYDVLTLCHVGCIQNGTGLLSAPNPATGLALGERFQIDIADPCSGMRSLFALLMISALYANMFLTRLWQQWLIFFSAIPLAIMGNLVRVLMLTFGSMAFGSTFAVGSNDTPSWFHELSGFVVFAVALGLELALGNFLLRYASGPHPTAETASRLPSAA